MGLIDKLKKVGGDIINGAKDKISETKAATDQETKLKDWQSKFLQAKKNYDLTIMDSRELQYLGTRELDPNVNKQTPAKKKANNIYNIIYEFTETQVDNTIPLPNVRSKRKGFDNQAQVIEDAIKNDLLETDVYRINDENERTTPIQGFSIFNVNWNPDFKHHLYRGEIEIDNPHPKCFIPQPGIYQVQKMDYYFLMFSFTKDYVKKRFKIDVENEVEIYPEINRLDGSDNTNVTTEKVTVITAVYKDDDGEIGKFSWCNDIPLEDLPNIYARRLKRCTKCNEIMNEDVCTCGNKKSKESIEDTETLETDVQRSDGSIIPMGTQIKYFTPTRYPIVIRKNVPIAFHFGGQSDVDIIRDQADALKKVITRIEEKIINGTAVILLPDNKSVSISDEIFKVIRGSNADLAQVKSLDIKSDIQQDLQFAQEQYKIAQSMLGITDSFQGKPDTTALSGKAKQISVNQAGGRMQSKAFNKRTAYKELFEIMFEFKLAFYDEIRPYLAKDEMGKDVYSEFNKYDFLQQDDAGEWFYNTDFLFEADSNGALLNDRMWMIQKAQEFFTTKAIDNMQLWTILDSLHFPMAKDIKGQIEKQQAQMMQQQQQAMQQQQSQSQATVAPQVPQQPLQPQQDQGHPADALFQALSPEQQQHLMSMSPDQQAATIQAMLQHMQGGGNNG